MSVKLDNAPDLIHVTRLPIRSHPHNFVFAIVHPKAEIRCERRIQQPKRVRKSLLLKKINIVTASSIRYPAARRLTEGSSSPLADPINRHHGCLFERASEEGTGSMAHMMVAKEDVVKFLGEQLGESNQTLKESSVAALTNQGSKLAVETLYDHTVAQGNADGYYQLGIGVGEMVPDEDAWPLLQQKALQKDAYSHNPRLWFFVSLALFQKYLEQKTLAL